MYCSNCGSPMSQSLSFCNRCGASLKEREQNANTGAVSSFLTAITALAVIGLGIMLGGALVLRRDAGLSQELVGVFMLFTFLIVGVSETMLIKQLSRLTGSSEQKRGLPAKDPTQFELRPAQPLPMVEPASSVTDNTTRTLEYSHRQ